MMVNAIQATGEHEHAIVTSNLSAKRVWAARILIAVPALFLLVDGGMKLFKPRAVVEGTLKLGYPESCIFGIGVVLLACTILYLIPRTAVLGAVLLTGYLGGAVATQVRVSAIAFNILFPVFLGCLLWAGLVARNTQLQRVFPVDKNR
jgi:hypothetical protein